MICCAVAAFAAPSSSQLSPADKHFIATAADVNMTEAHLGQMAENQAAGANVKDFAHKLTDDHSKAYGELLQLAQQQGDTSIPRGINIRTDHAAASLMHLKGAQFDRSFIRDEVTDHEKALAEFKREADHGTNPELKAWAQKMIPVLEDHLNTAKSLEKSEAKNGRMEARKS